MFVSRREGKSDSSYGHLNLSSSTIGGNTAKYAPRNIPIPVGIYTLRSLRGYLDFLVERFVPLEKSLLI